MLSNNIIFVNQLNYLCNIFTLFQKSINQYSQIAPIYNEPIQPCSPSPCGFGAICKERNGVGSCVCEKDYFGDPYLGCKPECMSDYDCPTNKACYQNKCKNVCIGACGNNAQCAGHNHIPSCYCIDGFTGNARANCYETPREEPRKL